MKTLNEPPPIPHIVECNNCNKTFDTRTNVRKKRIGKITDVGLECSHCNHFFHSYYLNSDLVKKQKQLKKLRGKPIYQKRLIAYQKKYNALQEKMVDDEKANDRI